MPLLRSILHGFGFTIGARAAEAQAERGRTVQVEQVGTSTVVRAPAFFDTKQPMAVTAIGAARIVRIAR